MTPTVLNVSIALVSYIVGVVSGIFLRDKILSGVKQVEQNTFVLVVVTSIWAFSMLFDILNPEYTTNPLVHGLMGAIVGFFYKPTKGKND